jgi:mycofactocin precursor
MDSPIAPATTSSDTSLTRSTDSVNGTSVNDTADDAVIDSDLLVEEISIDGMCGVY